MVYLTRFQYIGRIVKIMLRNTGRKGTYIVCECLPGEVVRVTIHLVRPWTFQSGQYVYIMVPSVGLWINHPFSLAWWTIDTPQPPNLLADPDPENGMAIEKKIKLGKPTKPEEADSITVLSASEPINALPPIETDITTSSSSLKDKDKPKPTATAIIKPRAGFTRKLRKSRHLTPSALHHPRPNRRAVRPDPLAFILRHNPPLRRRHGHHSPNTLPTALDQRLC